METYHKISTPFKRDMDGTITGQKGKLILGDWARPEFEYLADNKWEYTEKVDGTNIRIELSLQGPSPFMTVEYGGRTDNAVIPKPLLGHLEAVFPTFPQWRRDITAPSHGVRYSELVQWMVDNTLKTVTLYGEGYGPKIQGGGKYRDDHSFVLFDVLVNGFWLDRANVNDIASKLGIESVPVLGTGTIADAIDIVNPRKGGMLSQWGDFEAEGIVARPIVPLFNRKGERIITKIKAVDFR